MSDLYTSWVNDTTYNFETYPNGLLPANYTNVKLIAISSYAAASRIGDSNLYVMWRQLYPHLPQGTPDTPKSTVWLVFESKDGEIIVLATDWISGKTVVPVEFKQASVAITDTNYNEMMILRDFMTKRGMKFTINFQ